MVSISSSLFNEIGSEVKGWLQKPFNQSFFFWYFLPATGFIIVQLVLTGTALGFQAPDILGGGFDPSAGQGEAEPATALILSVLGRNLFAFVIVPLFLAVVLAALSSSILRLYQGTLPVLRELLTPRLKRNRQRSDAIYGSLRHKRRQYVFLATRGMYLEELDGQEQMRAVEGAEREQLLAQLKQEIQALHERCEANRSQPDLPVASERVAPTALGNVLALAEEYPFERYGMDAVVFWPRLRLELEKENLAALDNTFTTLTGLLNISLLASLFAVEAILVWLFRVAVQPESWRLLAAAPIALIVAWGAYRAAISAARTVGNLLRTAFDYHRHRVLERFNLIVPEDIEEERVVWLKLAAFVRRGESFYYPTEWRKSNKG
jgi:hypothetical protein